MNPEIERIERATRTPEYQTYAAMAGAAIAGALFAPTKQAQRDGLELAGQLQQKMADIVRKSA